MTIRQEILQEIKEIAPMLAAIEKKNPFRVPQGYFDSNEEVVNQVCTEKEVELPAVLRFAKGVNPFRAPEGYFEANQSALMHAVSSSEEAMPDVLQKLRQSDPFQVPQAYFETNQTALLSAVSNKEEELPAFLQATRKQNPFKVPQGYFEQLQERVMGNITGSESASLDNLKKDQPFQVPATYFEELPTRVMQRIREESGAKVVPMAKPSILRKLMPYVSTVAAVMLLALGITLFNSDAGGGEKPEVLAMADPDWKAHLANLSDDEINSALTESIDDLDEYYTLDNVGEFDIFTFSKFGDEFLNDYLLDEVDEDLLRELI